MYVITGAAGNISSKIIPLLNPTKNKVRIIGRDEKKLKPFVEMGAEAFIGTLEDAAFLTKAISGAKCVYAMIPPNYGAPEVRAYQNQIGENLASAIKNAGVHHVVNLSSIGAHLKDIVGIVNGLYDQEQRLNQLQGVNVLHLRPGFFMENNFGQLDLICEKGITANSLRGDLKVPQIATQDIAAAAAKAMLSLDYSGKVTRELLGARDVTMYETAAILGKAIGKPDLPYIQTPYDDLKQNLIWMGMSPSAAQALADLQKAFNEGAGPTETRSAKNTTPTTLEQFADIFASVYHSKV